MSIIAYPLEATEYTAEDVQSYLSTRTSGVYSEDITFTPEKMKVTVSPFLAWINYAKFKGCSVAVTEPETLSFSPAHAVLTRIDRIVLRLDLTVNKAHLMVLEGTPSSSQVSIPEISRTEFIYDLCLATVPIAPGATEIAPLDIASEILNEDVCGIMRDGVTGIPTAQLQTQAEALILKLHEKIKEVQEESAFMMSDVYDPQKRAKPVAFLQDFMVKDITDDFFESKESFSWTGKIHKQGNVIFGDLTGFGVAQQDTTLFKVKKKYSVVKDGSCVIMGAVAGGTEGTLETKPIMAIATGTESKVSVIIGSDIDGVIMISFTYLCRGDE